MKRQAGWGAVALLAAGLAASAQAAEQGPQGPLAGPLGEMGTAPPAKAKLEHTGKRAGKMRRHATAQPMSRPSALPAERAAPPEAPAGPPSSRAAAPSASDPISLGFKWQGNNDTAEKTRVQNYNGDAAGTGAAVGLNLHF